MSMQMLLLIAKWPFSSHEFDNQADAWPQHVNLLLFIHAVNVEYDAFFSPYWKVSLFQSVLNTEDEIHSVQ